MTRGVQPPPDIPGLTYVEVLGQGGFADVFRYSQLGRTVAVKVLTTDLSHNGQQAFEAEAQQMARLSNHPSIVSIYQAGVAPDGRSFLIMEVCQPRTLADRLAARAYPVAKALEITIQVAGAVESAHRLGVLHRDIKPANILFKEFGRAALTDFGISVSTQEGEQGAGVGVSPAWAPPEQVTKGSPMGPASDVYSLAATAWAMLAGRSPMIVPGGDNSNLAVMARVKRDPVPALGRADVPESLERVLRTALAKEASHRFATALEFGRALQEVQTELRLPVTPIEVGDEDGDDHYVEETGVDVGGTRISSFQVIDPESPPQQSSSARFGHDHPRTLTTAPDPIAPAASTGPSREPTGPSTTSPGPGHPDRTVLSGELGHGQTVAHPDGDQSTPAPRAGRVALMTVGGLVAAAVLGVVVWSGLSGDRSGTTQNAPTAERIAPADAIGATVPTPTRMRLTLYGRRVTATWVNPEPADGDTFLYRVIDPAKETPLRGPIEDNSVTVAATGSRTCVEVVLRRSNGQASEGVTRCVG